MVGNSLSLVLVSLVNRNARRAGEMDLIDFLCGNQKAYDMQHLWRSLRRQDAKRKEGGLRVLL